MRRDTTSKPGLSEGQEANDEWTVAEEGPISNLRGLFQEYRGGGGFKICKTGHSAARRTDTPLVIVTEHVPGNSGVFSCQEVRSSLQLFLNSIWF